MMPHTAKYGIDQVLPWKHCHTKFIALWWFKTIYSTLKMFAKMFDRADKFIAFTQYHFVAFTIFLNCHGCVHFGLPVLKGEVRTINDRNICERRSCMKNNGKSPTFKFVSGEGKRPSKVQRISRDWRLPGATHSSADLTWIRKWLKIQAPELSEVESVGLELGSCCSDLDN